MVAQPSVSSTANVLGLLTSALLAFLANGISCPSPTVPLAVEAFNAGAGPGPVRYCHRATVLHHASTALLRRRFFPVGKGSITSIGGTFAISMSNYDDDDGSGSSDGTGGGGSKGQEAEAEAESERLRRQAEELREQIRSMEEKLGDASSRRREMQVPSPPAARQEIGDDGDGNTPTLRNKRVLVVGANGRVGSMVCRYLLRNNPKTEVVAAVHYVGERSTRGYGRLSYEVGAEDGVGSIGAAWDFDNYDARFEFTDEMKSYNLQNLRVVEVELLDPVQCQTITEDVDCVIWCATDFNGNKPRAISGLNAAFLFRAVSRPTKGRVEVEGLRNLLGGLKAGRQARKWNASRDRVAAVGGAGGRSDAPSSSTGSDAASSRSLDCPSDPLSFVLVSSSEDAFADFETPFGSFQGIKREGERIPEEEFPSISHCVLQMSRYDDNFVEEGLDVVVDDGEGPRTFSVGDREPDSAVVDTTDGDKGRRRINRRDAARAAVEALTDASLNGKKVEVWSATR